MNSDKINSTIDYLKDFPQQFANIFVNYWAAIEKAKKNSYVPLGAGREEISDAQNKQAAATTKAKDDAFSKIEELKQAISRNEKNLQDEIALGLGLRIDAKDTQENVLREMRMNSAWDRLKPVFDREEASNLYRVIPEIIKQFSDASDLDSIAVLRREIPFYIRGRLAPREAEDVSGTLMEALDQSLAANTPEGEKALAFKREIEAGVYQLQAAANYTEHAIKNGETEYPMPAWEKGRTLIVNQKGATDANSKNSARI